MDERIYVMVSGEQKGPYLLPQVNAMWLNGQLTADALYWFEGMEEWKPLAGFMTSDEAVVFAEEDDVPDEIFVEHAGSGRIVTNFPQARLFDLAYRVLEGYGVSIGDTIEGAVITGSSGMNWSSFGQAIRLDLDYHPRGCAVSVASTSSQLYDWGRGKKDREEIISRLVQAIQDEGR